MHKQSGVNSCRLDNPPILGARNRQLSQVNHDHTRHLLHLLIVSSSYLCSSLDYSFAGYELSYESIPSVNDFERVFKVSDFNAFPNDGIDDSHGIQAAIDECGAKGQGGIIQVCNIISIPIKHRIIMMISDDLDDDACSLNPGDIHCRTHLDPIPMISICGPQAVFWGDKGRTLQFSRCLIWRKTASTASIWEGKKTKCGSW